MTAQRSQLFDPRALESDDAPRLFGFEETAQLFAIADQCTDQDRAALGEMRKS